jgi:hypothetical protein
LFDISPELAQLAKSYIKEGIVNLDDIIDRIHHDIKDAVGEFDKRDIRDALSGYGKEVVKLSKDEIDAQLRKIKTEARWISRLEDAEKGKRPLRTGFEREKETKTIKELKTKVRNALRENGIKIERAERSSEEKWQTALEAYKTRLENRKAELQNMLDTKNFAKEPRPELKLDEKAEKIKREVQDLKNKVESEIYKIKKANRTSWQKIGEDFVSYSRNVKLGSPTVIPKLLGASIQNIASEGISGAVGEVMKHTIFRLPKLRDIVENNVEADYKPEQIATEYRDFIVNLFSKETLNNLRTGKAQIDYYDSGKKKLPEEDIDFIKNLHKALKSPLRSLAFKSALKRRATEALKNGLDLNDESVDNKIRGLALVDADRRIFMQDNDMTRTYKNLTGFLGRQGAWGKVIKGVLDYLLPIIKVPTNFVNITGQYIAGNPFVAIRMGRLLMDGVENMTSEQKETFFRLAKRQGAGVALAYFAYNNPQMFGGFHHSGQKRNPNDLQAMEMYIGGVKVPEWLQDNPMLLTLQFWADLGRQNRESDKKHPELNLNWWAALSSPNKILDNTKNAALSGGQLVKRIPFTSQAENIINLLEGKGWKEWASSQLRGLTPLGSTAKDVAETMDVDEQGKPIKRKKETFLDYLKADKPILREQLPQDKLTPKQLINKMKREFHQQAKENNQGNE